MSITGLKPYSAMKDSSVPWLGEVPARWEVAALRHRYSQVLGKMLDTKRITGTNSLRYLRNTDVQWDRVNVTDLPVMDIVPGEYGRYTVQMGDLLVCEGGEVGRCAIWTGELDVCGFQKALHRLRPLKVVRDMPRFMYYALHAATKGNAFSDGHVSTIAHLTGDKLRAHPFPFPPVAEQAAIVRFLDHADRRIRRYIRAKQTLIKLLEEQKQTIIHHAVTRGLDRNVRLKPSGVEWLGDMPEHWVVRRNGRLFAQRSQTGFAELPILEVSLKTGVRIREFENTTRKQVMSDREKYKRAAKGDIAYNMMRMWQGAVGIAPVDGLVSPAYVVARPLPSVEIRYFASLFRTAAYMGEVDNCSRGIVKDRNRLYWQDFKQIFSPYPPLSEQVQIADAIDESTRTLQHAMDRIVREISLLREYRTRLIADVVTGKLDVREAAESLPDLPVESSVEIGPDDEIVASPEVDDTPESEDATA